MKHHSPRVRERSGGIAQPKEQAPTSQSRCERPVDEAEPKKHQNHDPTQQKGPNRTQCALQLLEYWVLRNIRTADDSAGARSAHKAYMHMHMHMQTCRPSTGHMHAGIRDELPYREVPSDFFPEHADAEEIEEAVATVE